MKNQDYEKSFADCVLVAIDYKKDSDHAVLIVGRKTFNADIEIINAFEGKEALDLYEKLFRKRVSPKNKEK